MASTHTFPVTVHEYPSTRSDGRPEYAYEHGFPSPARRGALVFIGGLGDGPHGVPYVRAIAKSIAETRTEYSVFELRLASSYSAFGYGSLSKDVEDISAFVAYLRKTLGKEMIVLMGHSTGCQDCMAYANYGRYGNHRVDGFILQGPVSDREAITPTMEKKALDESVAYAAQLLAEGRGDEIMPREKLPGEFRGSPVSAYRWHSLAAVG